MYDKFAFNPNIAFDMDELYEPSDTELQDIEDNTDNDLYPEDEDDF